MAVTLKGQTAVYEGTSTDTKPTDADNNAIFKELDTGIRYYYDGTNWNEIPSSGGGGGGGTGTDNYNDLNNKPSINGTTLSGNKSLDNLGIQAKLTFDSAPTEGSENPVESGGVYSALAGKQDAISDLSTIRSGAAAGATAVQPATLETALAGKQDALSSEQLEAVNSGVTSADVEQIKTNKNNILLNRHYGVKNIFIPKAENLNNPSGFTGTITRNADNSYTINGSTGGDVYYLLLGTITMPVGTFVLYARPSDKTGIFVYNDGDWADNDNSRYKTFSQPTSQNIFLRIAANQTLENYTIYPMICDLTAWNMSRDYEIGALSNAKLTEQISSLTPKTTTTDYTATAAETWEKTSLSIPVAGKKAVFFSGNIMYNNAEPLGVGIGIGNTFTSTAIVAIEESTAGTLRGALSCTGIYYNNSSSPQTLDLWVKYRTTQRNMITLMYRQL